MPTLPFKLNHDRRHHIPRQKRKVTNWPAYYASLRQRGSLTVWLCVQKAGMFSRGQTCRGRSQSPVVWIAEEMETKPSKPIDKASSGEVTSHRAVTTVNALWPRKVVFPRAEPATRGRRHHEQPKSDRYGCSPWWGGSGSTVTRTC